MEALSARFRFLAVHCLALLGPFYFNWSAFWLAVALHFVTGLGMTLSYHRNLAHRSFKLPKWLEYPLAYCGVLSHQGSPIQWVSIHRVHHQNADTSDDPHSPIKGFWYSHFDWVDHLFGSPNAVEFKNVGDLKEQWYYRFLHFTYPYHSVALGILLYAGGGLPYFVWGMGVRTVCVLHITFAVNSIGHMWGKQHYHKYPKLSSPGIDLAIHFNKLLHSDLARPPTCHQSSPSTLQAPSHGDPTDLLRENRLLL